MWKEKDNALVKEFEFQDFVSAFSFMTSVALVAEKMNHHPNWTNIYNKVSFKLNTHDKGDVVTDQDRKLAEAIDRIYGED